MSQDFGFFEFDFVESGRDNSVTERFHLFHCGLNFLYLFSVLAKRFEFAKQVEIVLDVYTALFACNLKEHVVARCHLHLHSALSCVEADCGRLFPELCVLEVRVDFVVVAHLVDVAEHIFHSVHDFAHHVAIHRQRLHPARQIEVYGFDGKFEQYRFENLADVILVEGQRVFDDNGRVVLLFEFVFEFKRAFSVDVGNVEDDDERLFALFEFGDDSFLCFDVVLPRYRAETTVGGDGKRNRAMLFYNLLRADFGGF